MSQDFGTYTTYNILYVYITYICTETCIKFSFFTLFMILSASVKYAKFLFLKSVRLSLHISNPATEECNETRNTKLLLHNMCPSST